MGLFRDVGKAIDSHLLSKHIGDYESLHFYNEVVLKSKILPTPMQFKKMINSLNAQKKSLEYICKLVDYYDSL